MPWSKDQLTWLITGASSGFGLQLTRLALSHGHIVIATSRTPRSNPELVSEIQSQGGRFLQLDIDAQDAATNLIGELEKDGIHVDVLVNAAGYSIHGPVESFTEEEVKAEMETTFFGPYRLIRAVVSGMRERRKGMIVSLSSGAGVDGRPSMGIYGASKAAMDGRPISHHHELRFMLIPRFRTSAHRRQRARTLRRSHPHCPPRRLRHKLRRSRSHNIHTLPGGLS